MKNVCSSSFVDIECIYKLLLNIAILYLQIRYINIVFVNKLKATLI